MLNQGLSYVEVSRQLNVRYENTRQIYKVFMLENRVTRKEILRQRVRSEDRQSLYSLPNQSVSNQNRVEVKDFVGGSSEQPGNSVLRQFNNLTDMWQLNERLSSSGRPSWEKQNSQILSHLSQISTVSTLSARGVAQPHRFPSQFIRDTDLQNEPESEESDGREKLHGLLFERGKQHRIHRYKQTKAHKHTLEWQNVDLSVSLPLKKTSSQFRQRGLDQSCGRELLKPVPYYEA